MMSPPDRKMEKPRILKRMTLLPQRYLPVLCCEMAAHMSPAFHSLVNDHDLASKLTVDPVPF